ncbi:hypothetical protein McanMca71_000593 [Microsporum canis]|uniref:MT-A70 family protein n=1 Tax=Arthroderma otae (strain ATCC MYA-4605 / CBS 113480) TaxID=554155 RepID=C5FM00_ARTOC|nr:MT-A70 family protein [Microsporum canis CBS 113480]EEQ30722.1 MT-A70 family protein [Microsporum canis CBS 113480]
MNSGPDKPSNGSSTPSQSSILYQDASQDLFIIDIPASISLAQHPLSVIRNDTLSKVRLIRSSEAIRDPYSGPSPEPKTASSREKILKLVPAEDHGYHASILASVDGGLKKLNETYQGEWCYSRRTAPLREEIHPSLTPRKRLRVDEPELAPNAPGHARLSDEDQVYGHQDMAPGLPPIILSPDLNCFPSARDIYNSLVKNPNSCQAVIRFDETTGLTPTSTEPTPQRQKLFLVPPESTFILTHIQPDTLYLTNPLSLIPSDQKFHFILADPPWPNRSVGRSRQYNVSTLLFDDLELLLRNIVQKFLAMSGIVGVWVTNSGKARHAVRNAFRAAGVAIIEEWIWVKTTVTGETVTALDGIWRKPYEVLIIGRAGGQERDIRRRIIAGVPDVHSRKPGMRELVGQIFFSGKEYTALEVFARSLTAGWWAVGDEVMRFNWDGWWAE